MPDARETDDGGETVARARLWRWERPHAPHRYGALVRTDARRWLVELVDGTGRTGWGEAAPLPGFGGEDGDACGAALRRAVRAIAGRVFPHAAGPLAEWVAGHGLPRFAHSALECAAIDLASQARGLSFAHWLDARSPQGVCVSALAGDLADDGVHERVARWCARGVRTVKLKVLAEPWLAQRARLQALRQAHPTLALRLDANGGWSLADWRARARELTALGIEHVEQPFAPEADAELAPALTAGGPAIAVDESLCRSRDAVARLVARDLDLAYVLKPAVLGALQAWELHRSFPHRVAIASHFADGPIGRACARALAQGLAIRDPVLAHGVAPELDRAGEVEGGVLAAPAGPGLGVEPSMAEYRAVEY